MEQHVIEETLSELSAFAAAMGRTVASHKIVLDRHEQLFSAAHYASETHFTAITELRQDMQNLSATVTSIERLLQQILNRLGMEIPRDPIN